MPVGVTIRPTMRRTLSTALAVIATFAIGGVWADRPGRTPPGLAMAGGIGAERGLARIACRGRQENVWHRSRGIVVDTGAPRTNREIVVATGHSLPPDAEALRRDCWIIGAYGAAFRVVEAWRPDDPEAAPAHDWTVLLIDGAAPARSPDYRSDRSPRPRCAISCWPRILSG
jgi:hypothetical protein